ncbi:MAG: UDP kinase [Polyangiaceae bacterium]|nr:UDP kinase [Polyangiaceae bacterium]
MGLAHLVIVTAVRAFADVLGISGQAHGEALALWFGASDPEPIRAAAGLAAATGVAGVTRARLFPALSEAVRSLGRPASLLSSPRAREGFVYAWMAALSLVGSAALTRAGAAPSPSPDAVAGGFAVTCAALLLGAGASLFMERRVPGRSRVTPVFRDVPSLSAATLAAAAHALGVWPGASRVGLSAAVLLALGVRPERALEHALVATLPFWISDFVVYAMSDGAQSGRLLAAAVPAFVCVWIAAALIKNLCAKRRVIALGLWMVPMSGALMAYARAI